MQKIKTTLLLMTLIMSACNEKGSFEPLPQPLFQWSKTHLHTDENSSGEYVELRHMWGSSKSDIYVVGYTSGIKDHSVFHYNGDTWNPVALSPFVGHNAYEIWEVFGFSETDIYFVGHTRESSKEHNNLVFDMIIHYDGISGVNIDLPKDQNQPDTSSAMLFVYGDRPDNIWAGGLNGSLYHYDGISWQRDSVQYQFPETGESSELQFTSVSGSTEHGLYLRATLGSFGDHMLYMFKHIDQKWIVIDSISQSFIGNFNYSPSGDIFAGGLGFYQLHNDKWSELINNRAVNGMHVIDNNNIFFTSRYEGISTIAFYNGSGFREYDEIKVSDAWYSDVYYDNSEIFALGLSSGYPANPFIYHGKLIRF